MHIAHLIINHTNVNHIFKYMYAFINEIFFKYLHQLKEIRDAVIKDQL